MTEIPLGGLPNTELPKDRILLNLPNQEEMVKRLTDAEIYGENEVSDSICDGFVNQVAGSRKDGAGLVLAWQGAIFDGLETAPPQSQETVTRYFNLKFYKVIDAIVPDQQAASHVKVFMRNFEEKVMGS